MVIGYPRATGGLLVAGVFLASGTGASAQSLVAAAGGNAQFQSTAAYVAEICPRLGPASLPSPTPQQADLRQHCAAAVAAANRPSPPAGLQSALDQLTPQEIISQDAVISGSVQSATSAVAARMSAMSRFSVGPDALGMMIRPIRLAENQGDGPSAAGSALAEQGRLQTFGTLTYSGGDQNRSALEAGFDMDLKSVTAGMDYRYTPEVTAGVAIGYGETKLDFTAGGGALRSRALTVSVYALVQPTDRLDVSMLLAYSRVSYRSSRPIQYTIPNAIPALPPSDTVNETLIGRTHGDQFESTIGGVYNLGAGEWIYGPAGQISASRLEINGFGEAGVTSTSGLGFAFPDQRATSLQASFGFDVSRAISTNAGVISPYARVRGIYEMLDKQRTIAIRYVNDPNQSAFGARLTTSPTDRDRYLVGGGVAAQFAGGLSAFFDGQTLLGLRDVTQYTLSIGARYAF